VELGHDRLGERIALAPVHRIRRRRQLGLLGARHRDRGQRVAPAPPPPTGTDVSNWRVVQANSSYTFTLPAGTAIPDHGYLVIGRNASKAAFEAYWNVALPPNAVYLDAGDSMPVINGDENFTLYDATGRKVDGRTVSMSSAAGRSYQRTNPCLSASKASSWTSGPDSGATPGSGAGSGCAKGIVINEFSDASGTGNYVYEFIELHNDR